MCNHPVLRLRLASLLLLLGLLAACGGAAEAPSEETAPSDAPPTEDTRAAAAPSEACPFSEDPSTTYEPGELLLKFTFQYPSSWEITNETDMESGMVRLTMRRPFEVNGSRRSLALELIQTGRAASKETIDRMTAPVSIGGRMAANQEHESIQLGGEAIRIGRTITDSKVVYALGVPGDDGYHLTNLHIQWAGDLCKEEVLRLGSEMLKSIALR